MIFQQLGVLLETYRLKTGGETYSNINYLFGGSAEGMQIGNNQAC